METEKDNPKTNPALLIGGHNLKAPDPKTEPQVSIVRTEGHGFFISVSRSLKTGKTADEMTKVRLEGYADDLPDALGAMKQMDKETICLLEAEIKRLAAIPAPSP